MILIVGAGLSAATIAERYASQMNKKVLIIEKRDHIAGNCYDYIDQDTNIRVNKYGAHLFHTNSEKVWNYIKHFATWIRWEHTVLSKVGSDFVNIPVNMTTINRVCNENLQDLSDMDEWLHKNQIRYDTITNSEEMAMSRVGKILYETMFKPYTIKQWNKDPCDLDASVLARIPLHKSFDTRYFNDKYQYLPKEGYTGLVMNMLNHPNINVLLNTDFFEWTKHNKLDNFEKIFYTGPIDLYFNDIYGKLEYRSIDFYVEKKYNTMYYQPTSVVNYPELDVSFTRIVEYKHFLHQYSPHTIIVSETTNDVGEPYYPVPTDKNQKLYLKYQELAQREEITSNVIFVGRLANYKYFNMDQAIENALNVFDKYNHIPI